MGLQVKERIARKVASTSAGVFQRLGLHSLDVTLAYLADEDDTSEPVREQVNSAFSMFG